MSLRLISANELEDVFLYGIDDMAVLGDQELDAKVIDLIRQQPTIKAVPYYEIAQAILKVRGIKKGFDEIPRQEVIDILWKMIDDKSRLQKSQEIKRIDTFEYLKAIPDISKKDYGKVFEVKCPCGGKMKVTRVVGNGHLHAKCDSCQFSLIE